MIAKKGEAVIADLPPGAVVMILRLPTSVQVIKMKTAMMRISEKDFDAIPRPVSGPIVGQPLYWTPRANGKTEVYPVPDVDYEIQVRDSAGNDLSRMQPSVNVAPVMQMAQAFERSAAAAREAELRKSPRAERFTGRNAVEDE